MPGDLYDTDILDWAEQQSALIARLASGERVNDRIDWPHVVEELRDLGLSELRACESLLRQALVHLLKLRTWPDGAAAHWRGEVVAFLADAQSRFTPSMRQRIDLERLYEKAVAQLRALGGDAAFPERCPYSLDDLLADPTDIAALLARLDA